MTRFVFIRSPDNINGDEKARVLFLKSIREDITVEDYEK